MANLYLRIPEFGSASWKSAVASSAALPLSGNNPGDARVTLDDNAIHIWGTDNTWHIVSGGGGGVASVGATAPVASSGGANPVISMPVATGSADGYLSSADWNTFNSKQAAGSYITSLTGDVTATGPGAASATIAANAVENSMLAQMPANTLKGNNTGVTADPLNLTATQATALLNNFVPDTSSVAGTKGLVPAPAAGRSLIRSVLGADGTFSANFPEETPSEGVTAVTVWNEELVTANQWINMTYAPEIRTFCAIGSSGTNRALLSQDGETWTSYPVAVNNTWTAVAWSNTLRLFVAVAFDGTTSDNVMTSADGQTWTSQSSPQANQWYSVCWSPALKLFCATSLNGTNRVMTSSDGVAWNVQSSPTDQWYSVCWADYLNLFVAVGLSGNIMTSPDGAVWTSRTGGIGSGHDVTYSPELGLLVAVGLTGTRVMTSTNGINWDLRSSPLASWRRVRWAKALGLFVAVASGGEIMTSPDGITWTSRTSPSANQFYGLAYSDDFKIVCASSITGTNRIIRSTYIKGLNTSGATGPAGPAGATGPTGPVGPASATGDLITADAVQTVQQTTTSSTFVDVPGLSTTITTTRDCRVIAQLASVLTCTSGTAVGEIRLVIDAQNGTAQSINLPNTTDTKEISSNFRSTSLVAGTYTVKVQYRETSGLGTLALNTGILLAQAQQGAGPYSISQASIVEEDWVAGSAVGNAGWTSTVSGTGAATSTVSTNVEANRPGVAQLATGTTATGRAALTLGAVSSFFGGGICTVEMSVRIPTLSTVTEEFNLRLGYGDTVTADQVDGVYFEYDRLQSVNWRCKTANNSVRSTVDSGVAVLAGSWVNLRFVVNAAGTSVDYYINGALVGTLGTNIPVTNARICAPLIALIKTAGTTSRTVLVDYYKTQTVFTTPR